MLRKAFASALRFMRRQTAVAQSNFEGGVSQSHISRLERGESSVTLETLDEIAAQLKVHPLTLVALTCAASEQVAPSDLLARCQRELEAVGGLNAPVLIDTEPAVHPRIMEAAKVREEVQRLKALGHTKAEIARLLNISRSTAGRHW